jgi:O-antigen ligase
LSASIKAPALPLADSLPRGRRFPAVLTAVLLLIPLGALNRFIFIDDNLPLLAALLAITALLITRGRLPTPLFPGVTAAFACLILYAWLRLDDPGAFDVSERTQVWSGFTHVLDMALFYVIFVCAAFVYARTGQLSRTLWFLICGYIAAYMLRNSGDIAGLQEGYNLSPGFVICSLLPFALMTPQARSLRPAPLLLALVCAFWLALIGARAATGTVLVVLAMIYAWPLITRNRTVYNLTFLALIVTIVVFHVLYFVYATTSTESLVAGSSIGILEKRIGTRLEIWLHLSYLILQAPWLGYGTDQTTLSVAPLPILEFSLNRQNLGSHSLYFELLYRLGIAGLAGCVLVLFAIWRWFWAGRHEWTVRVAGAFLAGVMVFSTTAEYMFFSAMRLESGFAWAALGVGAGACLRARKLAARQGRNG